MRDTIFSEVLCGYSVKHEVSPCCSLASLELSNVEQAGLETQDPPASASQCHHSGYPRLKQQATAVPPARAAQQLSQEATHR